MCFGSSSKSDAPAAPAAGPKTTGDDTVARPRGDMASNPATSGLLTDGAKPQPSILGG